MRKITILGERPGPNTDPARPLYPHTTTGAAAHLAKLMGLTIPEYLEITDRYNASDAPLGYESCASMIPRDRVKRIWDRLTNSGEIELLIVCGREPQRALPSPWRADMDLLKLEYVPFGTTVLIIPHPSGRNRVFNDASYKREVEKVLRHEIALWRLGGAGGPGAKAAQAEHVLDPSRGPQGLVAGGALGQGAAGAADAPLSTTGGTKEKQE